MISIFNIFIRSNGSQTIEKNTTEISFDEKKNLNTKTTKQVKINDQNNDVGQVLYYTIICSFVCVVMYHTYKYNFKTLKKKKIKKKVYKAIN